MVLKTPAGELYEAFKKEFPMALPKNYLGRGQLTEKGFEEGLVPYCRPCLVRFAPQRASNEESVPGAAIMPPRPYTIGPKAIGLAMRSWMCRRNEGFTLLPFRRLFPVNSKYGLSRRD